MTKWYQSNEEGRVVISSRVRLARNLAEYHFASKMQEKECANLAQSVRNLSAELEGRDGMKYYSCCVNKLSDLEKESLKEWYIISDLLAKKKQETALVLSEDEGISIMVNEEDHIRIQSVAPGADLAGAYERAEKIDGCLEKLGYAFDGRYGYLTTFPLNAGTGMRASFLMFLPALTLAGRIQKLADEIGKFGVMLRGVPGEGTNTQGYLYRISNQKTLGCNEREIMSSLTHIMRQIEMQELKCRDFLKEARGEELTDKTYRFFGIMRYGKRINVEEAMLSLAQLKLGMNMGLIRTDKNISIYEQMIRIQPANLQKICGKTLGKEEEMAFRADYLNKIMSQVIKD